MLGDLSKNLGQIPLAAGPILVDADKWKGILYYTYSSIIILFFLVLVATAVIFLLLGLLKILGNSAARRHAARRAYRAKFARDGRPYPPTGRGMCDSCSRSFETVYHLPSGNRLCPKCYRTYCSTTRAQPAP
ncbi:MAG: hypothetical protein KAX78_10400 [Phycisphaerae bacterium]|nr:hypothetical protein [Phycisphaerae bacterium]